MITVDKLFELYNKKILIPLLKAQEPVCFNGVKMRYTKIKHSRAIHDKISFMGLALGQAIDEVK